MDALHTYAQGTRLQAAWCLCRQSFSVLGNPSLELDCRLPLRAVSGSKSGLPNSIPAGTVWSSPNSVRGKGAPVARLVAVSAFVIMARSSLNVIYVDRLAHEQTPDPSSALNDGVANHGTTGAQPEHLKETLRILKEAFGDSMYC